jgi:hypothetical protein
MPICKLGALAFAAVLGSVLLTGPASAVPANGLAVAAKQNASAIQEVRWVGGWRGLGWRGVGWRAGWAGAGGRFGWGRGLYAYAGPAFGRPLYAYGAPGWRWNRWGWRRPLLAAATVAAGVGLAAAWDSNWYADNGYYANTGWNNDYYQQSWSPVGSPYYAYAGPTWTVGGNPAWAWRGWGWRGW